MKKIVFLVYLNIVTVISVYSQEIISIQSGSWNDPNTWSTNTIPTSSDDVKINMGFTVTLSASSNANSIMLMGVLKPETLVSDFNLSTQGIIIESGGLLQIGTATSPYLGTGCIILTGSNPNAVLFSGMSSMGSKVIGVMPGGRLDLFGFQKNSWTQINSNVYANANTITLKENVNWEINDEIVITTTDFSPYQSEKRKIINIEGLLVTLDVPLNYMHWGTIQNYSNISRNFVVDERAEVGLLTHNLKIQGDSSSLTNGYGGHIMSMPGSIAYADNIELYLMGQKSKVGKYPWHWHLVGDASGQFIKNSSIHKSFNRIITVHGTNNTTVEGNVGYDFIGHGFFLENGDETGNLFKNNLGILCKRPVSGEQTTPSDIGIGASSGASPESFPATFWITNPSNDFIGNVAAGSDGSGFWHLVLSQPLGNQYPTMIPGTMPMGIFDDNKSHSANFNWGVDGGVDKNTGNIVDGHYRPELNGNQFVPQINRFTGYKSNDRNVWLRANKMELFDCSFADNGRATFFSYHNILYNSIIVGKSNNIGSPTSASELLAGRTLPYPTFSINNENNSFRGHSIYDGPSGIVNTHFVGFNNIGAKAFCFQTNGASRKSTNHFSRGITFDVSIPEANKVDFTPASFKSYMFLSGLIDEDGSITGIVNSHITPIINTINDGHLYEVGNNIQQDNVIKKNEWGAWITTNKNYNYFYNDDGWGVGQSTPRYIITKYPNGSTHAVYATQTQDVYFDNPVITNDINYSYHVQYQKIPNNIFISMDGAKTNQESLLVAYENMPSNSVVTSGAILASNLYDLKNSTINKYFKKDNTIWLKLVTTFEAGSGFQRQFGADYKYNIGGVQICQDNSCSNSSGNTDFATLIDYGLGNDDRDKLTATDNLPISIMTTNIGNVNFNIFNNGNGINGSTEYQIDFNRQVWEDFNTLNLDYSGPPVEVMLKDTDNNFISLGTYSSSDSDKIKIGHNFEFDKFVKINQLVLRFHESKLGNINIPSSDIVQIRSIKLGIDVPTNYSVSSSETINDSDGDGMSDYTEFMNCRNPNIASDFSDEFNDVNSSFKASIININNFDILNGTLSGLSATGDPYFFTNSIYNFSGSTVSQIKIKIKANISSSTIQIFWENEDGGFSEVGSASNTYTGNGDWQEIIFNMSSNLNWTGKTIKRLRIDPVSSPNILFEIDYIRGQLAVENPTGLPCDDGNSNTINDKYIVCAVCKGENKPLTGSIRFNSQTTKFEGWDGLNWVNLNF